MRLVHHRRFIAALLMIGLFFSLITLDNHPDVFAEETEIPIRYPYGEEYSEPAEGFIYVESTGSFSEDTVQDILDRVNEIRYEACLEGLPAPSFSSTEPTGRTLTLDDYKPVKWSESLQWQAQVRAAETSVMWTHDRPNNDPYQPKKPDKDISSFYEVLAGSTTVARGIQMWYSEKNEFIQNDGLFLGNTGHYGAMIDPNVEYIGMSCFKSTATGVMSHTMYGHAETVSEKDISIHGPITCLVEVANENVISVSFRENNQEVTEKKLVTGDTWQAEAYAKVRYSNFKIHSGMTFSSSAPTVASVDDSGLITAKTAGTTTITVQIDETRKVSIPVTVRTISSITAPDEITVASGTSPENQLPSTVKATWSDEEETDEAVTWGTIPDTWKNREGGSFSISGTLTDYPSKKVSQTVTVEPAFVTEVTDPEGVSTQSGSQAVLPETVLVSWSNGDTSYENVTWDDQPAASYGKTEGGSYTVEGTVLTEKTSVNVTVLPATIDSVSEIEAVETTEGIAPVLPTEVSVTWSNGDTTTKRTITWNTVPKSDYAVPDTSFTVQGTVSDFAGTKTNVSISVHVIPRVLDSISFKENSISGTTSYHRYNVDQFTGEIIASYNNGTTEEIEITKDMIQFDPDSTEASQTALITYAEGDESYSLPVTLTLESRTGITVIELPEKTVFLEGDEFTSAGLRFGYIYSDGTVEEISEPEYPLGIGGYDPDLTGYQKINILYDGFSASYNVYVTRKILTSIEVTADPEKTLYVVDQPFEAEGIEVTAHFNNGTSEVVQNALLCISTDATVKTEGLVSVDTSAPGETEVFVSYTDPYALSVSKQTSFIIQVEERVVTELTLIQEPVNTVFSQNDPEFDHFSTATVKAVYNDGLYEEELAVTAEMIRDFDLTKVGVQTVRIVLGDCSVSFEAEVTAPPVYPYRNEWVDGKWYDSKGHQFYEPQGSWHHNKKGWWYEDTSGWYPKNSWQKIDGKWYFFHTNGYMASEEWVKGCYWLSKNGAWIYKAKASWHQSKKGWWFGDTTGWYAKSSWQKICGKWYYFDQNGYMARNRYIGKYYVGDDGVWKE